MNRRKNLFYSSLIPHPSSLIPHPSSLIPHPSSLIPSSLCLVLPQAEAAEEGVLVVAQAAALRQCLQLLGIAAAEHDVVGDEGCLETADDIVDCFLPPLLAQPLQAADADVVLEGALLLVGQMAQLHRGDDVVDDQGVAQ